MSPWILPAACFLRNTIVLSNCIIVWYKCCSDATMVAWCHNSTIWCHNSSTMATINMPPSSPKIDKILVPPWGFSQSGYPPKQFLTPLYMCSMTLFELLLFFLINIWQNLDASPSVDWRYLGASFQWMSKCGYLKVPPINIVWMVPKHTLMLLIIFVLYFHSQVSICFLKQCLTH